MNLATVVGGDSIARTRHTKNVVHRLPRIADLVDKAVGVQREFANAFEALAGKTIKLDDAMHAYRGFVVPAAAKELSTRSINTVDRLGELFRRGAGNMGQTRADLFSGVTDFYTHESSGNSTNPQRQFVSSDFGTGADRKRDFFAIVTDDAKLDATIERGARLLELKAA
jgi:hypothetical protein